MLELIFEKNSLQVRWSAFILEKSFRIDWLIVTFPIIVREVEVTKSTKKTWYQARFPWFVNDQVDEVFSQKTLNP